MKELDFDKYYEAGEPEKRERAYAWATAIGLQDVTGSSRPSICTSGMCKICICHSACRPVQ